MAEVSTLSCLSRKGLRLRCPIESLAPLPPFVPALLSLTLVPFQNLTSQGSRPFCADCKTLFFVIIIFFFFSFFFFPFLLESRNLLTGKSVLELGEVCFLFHAKAITRLSGMEPAHVCAQTVQLPSLHPGKCVQLSGWNRPGKGNANQAAPGSAFFNQDLSSPPQPQPQPCTPQVFALSLGVGASSLAADTAELQSLVVLG